MINVIIHASYRIPAINMWHNYNNQRDDGDAYGNDDRELYYDARCRTCTSQSACIKCSRSLSENAAHRWGTAYTVCTAERQCDKRGKATHTMMEAKAAIEK